MVQNKGNCWRTLLPLVMKSFPYICFQILGTLCLSCPLMALAPSSAAQRHCGQSFYSTTTSLQMSGSTRRISSQLGIYQALKNPPIWIRFCGPSLKNFYNLKLVSLHLMSYQMHISSPCLFNHCLQWHSCSLHNNAHEGTQCNSSIPHVWDSRCA